MKKLLSIMLIVCVVISAPSALFARSTAERMAERITTNVTSNVLSNVITDSIREHNAESKAKKRQAEVQAAEASRYVVELSMSQYNDFLEYCVAGSLENFKNKFEAESISSKAYLKGRPEKTLVKLAAESPNSEIVQYLFNNADR